MSEQAASEQDGAELASEDLDLAEDTGANDAPSDADAAPTEESDEVTITLGDESPTPEDSEVEKAPDWVRELRKSKREADRRIRELEAKLTETTKPKAGDVGPKPTLADFGYDEEAYAPALEQWVAAKAKADADANALRAQQEQAQAAWQARLNDYESAGKALKVPDFEDAKATAEETLSGLQAGIIVNGADRPAELMYLLGKNPSKAKELATITDPVKFAFAVAKLETQMKVQPKKIPPPAERRVQGNAHASGDTDGQERRLREEAARTGDYSKLFEYRRQRAA